MKDRLLTKEFSVVVPIFGVELSNDKPLTLGRFILLPKNHISNLINENVMKENDEPQRKHIFDLVQNKYTKQSQETKCVYCIATYSVNKPVGAIEKFETDTSILLNTLRYMVGIKHNRIFINLKNHLGQRQDHLVLHKDGFYFKTADDTKDYTLHLEDFELDGEKNGNLLIWKIIAKDNQNDLEKRILQSIRWIGTSIEEDNKEMAITQIAIAFESLLKEDQSVGPITSGVQKQISESVAFILGKNLKERTEFINKFEELYTYRSSVVHGSIKKKKTEPDYNYYFWLFKATLTTLLTDKKFSNCKTLSDVNKVINNMKYS